MCVDDERPPFSFVVVEGVVEMDDDREEVRRWATRIGGRYMGAERAEEYGARNGVAGELVVYLRPERVISACRTWPTSTARQVAAPRPPTRTPSPAPVPVAVLVMRARRARPWPRDELPERRDGHRRAAWRRAAGR